MSNIVFILGAGASEQAGVPVMKDFLDRAYYLWKTAEFTGDVNSSFEMVFEGISQLQLVHSKSQLDIKNVESVFAAFEMGRTLQKFGNYTSHKIENLVAAMRQVIVYTVQSTMKTPIASREKNVLNPPIPYDGFMNLITWLQKRAKLQRTVSVITFNYDLAIDLTFHTNKIPYNYALGENSSGIHLLKLHGSVNWGWCPFCQRVVPWYLSDFFKNFILDLELITKNYFTLDVGSHFDKFIHSKCQNAVDKEPVIVPPTWSKTQYYENLSMVWGCAAKELSDAENIFVIGYSLPETDTFFRYLYALGTVGKTPLKRLWVFNPDDSGETKKRFKALLGPGADARFRYIPDTFSHSFQTIEKQFPAH